MTGVKLTGMQRVVASLYFEQGLRQHEIGARLRMKRQAIAMRIQRIRRRYTRAGLTPPGRPGVSLRSIVPQSLSGFWDRNAREYVPANN
jgi:hypothetical protein